MATDRANRGTLHAALAQPAANDASCTAAPAEVRVVTLNEGAVRVLREHEAGKPDELWHGTVYGADGEDVPVFVRLAQPQPLVAELVCSVFGRALGLPVPEPFLVQLRAGTLPGSRFVTSSGPGLWAFASEDVGAQTFAQLLRRDSKAAQKLLREWEHLGPLAAFDEWLANPDRNLGNILFVAGTLWLIDHAEALGGSARRLFALSELSADSLSNQIGDLINNSFSLEKRAAYASLAGQWIAAPAGRLPLLDALHCAGVKRWHTDTELTELLDFVRLRLTLAHSLLCSRLGIPQLTLPQVPQSHRARADSAPSSNSPPS